MLHLQLRHTPMPARRSAADNIIDTATLRPLTRVALHEALRERGRSQAVRAGRRRPLRTLVTGHSRESGRNKAAGSLAASSWRLHTLLRIEPARFTLLSRDGAIVTG